jgi:hypothetical protein
MNLLPSLDVARSYLRRGWMPLPVPFRSKNPGFPNWQKFTVTEADLHRHFNGHPQNIGVLLGKASNNLTDVDLDCAEAVALAPCFLPQTGSIFGRESRPRSHWLYITNIPKKVTFSDPLTGNRLIEILTNGQQAIFPGSTHEGTGELVSWYEDEGTKTVQDATLLQAVKRLAATTLLTIHWPKEGSRQDAALALAGGLIRCGWSEDEACRFIEAICREAQDEETRKRVQAVVNTATKLQQGMHVTGWPTLAKFIDPRILDKVREWLDLRSNETQKQTDEAITPTAWPQLHPAALYGMAGDFVNIIEPHSEADPVALLVQFLIGFGNLVGRGAHFIVEADKHFTNVFAVLVGGTGTGRKGTAWGQAKRIFEALDETWARDCITGGMSSGEGLIYNVRDAVLSKKQIKAGDMATGIDEVVIADKGVSDKRLLVFEGEFASVLRSQGREGNTLSMVIRNLWDTGDARSMVKNSPTRTTRAHVSIVGHITKDELRSCLDGVEQINGYVNRFLWVCTRRSKFLPRGGRLSTVNFGPLIRCLRGSVDFAREVAEMSFDDDAGSLWDGVYEGLETGRTGLLGKVTQRASPYVLRLSCLYALLDCSATVRREHLVAALALWKYCEDSARFIFGERTGDRLADDVLRALREVEIDGLTRTDISNLFGRNLSAARIGGALASLEESGLAHSRSERVEGSKRPVERWFATVVKSSVPYELHEINEINVDSDGLNSSNSSNS